MKKVIIIDDRKERKKLHLSSKSLEELENLQKKGLLCIRAHIDCDTYDMDEYLGEYSLIAIHGSYMANNNIYNQIIDYAQKNNKLLIVFSGGIAQNLILQNGNQLNINSVDFYSDSLIPFIEDYCNQESMQSPLLQFLYGDSWKLTLLLQYRYLLWTYGEDIDFIDDPVDEAKESWIREVLWDDDTCVSIDEINELIEIEKAKL